MAAVPGKDTSAPAGPTIPAAAVESPPSRRPPLDATAVLTVYLVLALVIPSQSIIAPLGTLGAPSTLFAVLVFGWWIWDHLHRARTGQQRPQWVRRAAIVMIVVMLVVYRHAMLQPVVADELTPADSGLVRFVALMGVVLAASDGVTSREGLRTLLRRMAILAHALAFLALLQFLTRDLIIDRIPLPGLSNSGTANSLLGRAGFLRPSGTASHPIEFGAVLGTLLPIVITRARVETKNPRRAWLGVAVVGTALMVSMSRTALICGALGFAVLLPLWSRRARWTALGASAGLVAVASLAVPGLLGSLRGLFLGSADDPSVQSRTAGYAYATEMFTNNPWLGKGYGTFLPRYYIFDNGYLQLLMEAGLIGVTAFLVLLFAAAASSWRASRLFAAQRERELSRALFGGTLAGSLSVAFFDLFAFPQSAACLALVVGLSGAALRLARDDHTEQQAPQSTLPLGETRRVIDHRGQPADP